ncbi:PSD1 and planctomycete cytochrome C domain-containing protein [Thalassoroseus pseudoceratinae]|uniref:PSD1 and planctomycete cytochrome C domain-containing protein n=1 Tax=Thalassoroseus pseudoceratinae TaxID=2713176 RepID=UPI001422430C|nr:PSD1 and planctomycete cytochrome C domain-containing protein [Thalassoroseus pseudoceratinae]
MRSFACVVIGLVFQAGFASLTVKAGDEIDFNRDVRPILSEHCFACHGPDQNVREAELRLDTKDGLFEDRGGYHIIDVTDVNESELLARVTSDDPSLVMPPADSNKPLTPEQIATLKRWVTDGAKWEGHWAYVVPVRSKVPDGNDSHPIDRFVRARLNSRGLEPSPPAQREVLIRRLSFDLRGLPPSVEEVRQFRQDDGADAYGRLVDQFLDSQAFGERMSQYWLDLVRYADTNGIHGDNHRNIWLYRDYVIRSFNENKPFDEITIEHLAGDLLPNATDETRIASGYNRLLMTTREGGAQPKEYTAKYAADRVRNVSEVWLGTTMGCAECHDHKYDPVLTKDFYAMEAFFADIQETPVGQQKETAFPTAKQSQTLKNLDNEIAQLREELKKRESKFAVAEKPDGKTKPDDIRVLATPELNPLRDRLKKLEQSRKQVDQGIPRTLITTAVKPRTIRVLPRGNWLDDSGPVVSPATPEFLPPLTTDGRADRLDLARWLVSEQNPLTARVYVNRLWALFFGEGLARSLGDLGSQGTWPTHPRLLDWLAVEFRESGWDVKHMVRLIVTSKTYQQSSQTSPSQREADPFNEWLARQSRWRLPAETIRDNALAVSGLLDKTIGGPSVKPYQPAGYWSHLNFPRRKWQADSGQKQYRRGLYTYWCRTFLHPSMLAFDASTREECTVQRPRSNTPLQALVLLNDPTYVEAARQLAATILQNAGSSDDARIEAIYLKVLSRRPSEEELGLLVTLVDRHRSQYADDPAAVAELLSVGQSASPATLDPIELAAWTSVARILLNLNETITRP